MKPITAALLGFGASVMFVSGAVAGAGPVISVPGPLAGVGLPAIAVVGGVYWLIRKFQNR